MRRLLYLFALLGLVACGSDDAPDRTDPTVEPTPPPPVRTETRVPLIVNLNYFRLRDRPGSDGELITMLAEGDTLYELGEISDFTTAIRLRGVQYNDPWIRVETADGTHTGWVYGGGVSFDPYLDNPTTERLMDRRLRNLFGDSIATAVAAHRVDFRQIQSQEEFARTLRGADRLLDAMLGRLEDILDLDYILQAPDGEMPDLFWLEAGLPGFQEALVAEGTAYDFFTDWRQWAPLARRTTGTADDDYVQLMFALYRDSVEHYFPAYFLQTWDYGGDSELGAGVHFRLLDKMNKALAMSDLFAPEIEQHKRELLDDILEGNSYWLRQEPILEELDAILDADFGILTETDLAALRARRAEFERGPSENLILNNRQLGIGET